MYFYVMRQFQYLLISLFLSASLLGQTVKYSNEFLAIGVGARQMGMGNAGISSTRNVTAGYWNPAGLSGMPSKIQVAYMHSEYFAGIAKYDYGAIAAKLDSVSAASVSFIRFGVDNIPNTIQLVDANGNVDYDKISKFSATDFAAFLTYSRKIEKVKGLEVGGSAKIIRRRLGDFGGAWGFGLDAAANYTVKGWRFSAVGRDITGTFNAWTYTLDEDTKNTFALTDNEIPKNSVEITVPRLLLGVSKKYYVWKGKVSLLGEINLVNTFDGKRNAVIKSKTLSMDPQLGFEAGYQELFFLRFGFNNIQKYTDIDGKYITTFQPNMGAGIKYKIFTLDYAFTNIGSAS
ncbi:MAG TPA: PorV/PorQ family protein, partial [Bacteroidia bacterium]